MDFKELLKKIWYFIWEEDSLLSWIVNVILAFILIKYILFPVLGLILGSQFPVVAVVSTSMEHGGSFDDWWQSNAVCGTFNCYQKDVYSTFGIDKTQFKSFKFSNGLNMGDVIFLTSTKNLKLGDTVVFFAKDGRPIIHRVINLNPIETKGDNNIAQIQTNVIDEKNIQRDSLVGKASLRLPFLGYVKIGFAYVLSLFGLQVK